MQNETNIPIIIDISNLSCIMINLTSPRSFWMPSLCSFCIFKYYKLTFQEIYTTRRQESSGKKRRQGQKIYETVGLVVTKFNFIFIYVGFRNGVVLRKSKVYMNTEPILLFLIVHSSLFEQLFLHSSSTPEKDKP